MIQPIILTTTEKAFQSYLKGDILRDGLSFHPEEYDGCAVDISWECPKCDGKFSCTVPAELTIVEDIFDYALDRCFEEMDCSMTDKLEYKNCEIKELFTL
jgi:hypothetical protein